MRDGAISLLPEEVRALLEGRKTQTRLPLDPLFAPASQRWVPELEAGVSYAEQGWWTCEIAPRTYTGRVEVGVWPGGDLWVQEAWRPGAWDASRGVVAVDYRASPEQDRTPWCTVPADEWPALLSNMANDAEAAVAAGRGSVRCNIYEPGWTWDRGDSPCLWRTAEQMPRWASRLTLTVTEVRVQRLQDITEEDALAESIRQDRACAGVFIGREGPGRLATSWPTAFEAFADRWDCRHGPGAWHRNPLVAAITFTVAHCNIDAQEPRP